MISGVRYRLSLSELLSMILCAIENVTNSQLAIANALVLDGEFLNAKEVYEECISSESDNSAAWYGLGVVNHHLRDEDAAIVAFERAFLLNRFHAPTAANLAVLYQDRDEESAVRYAMAARELGIENEILNAIVLGSDEEEQETEEKITIDDSEEQELGEPVLISGAVSLDDSKEDGGVDLIDRASRLLEDGELESALSLISPALEGASADDAELWYLCGKALAGLGLIDDAINTLRFCLEIDTQHARAAELLSEISSDSTEEVMSVEAQKQEEAPPIDEEEDAGLTNAGTVEYSNYEEGEIFDERTPQSHDELDTVESPLIALEDSLVVLVRRAKEASESGDHATAVQTWKKIIEDHGSTSEAWHGMALALEAAGHVEKAEQCREKAEELMETGLDSADETSESVDLVAAAEEARNQVSESDFTTEDHVNVAIEWYNKGLTLLSEDKGLEALNCFEKAISAAPRGERDLRVRSHNGRGHSLHQLGRFAESIQSYHQAISMDPSIVSGRTLYNMGSSYAAMEHFHDAIRCFEQALERGLDEEESRLCKTQLNRCSLLLKEQQKGERLQA